MVSGFSWSGRMSHMVGLRMALMGVLLSGSPLYPMKRPVAGFLKRQFWSCCSATHCAWLGYRASYGGQQSVP